MAAVSKTRGADMATAAAIDPRQELAALEDELAKVAGDLARRALAAAAGGTGLDGALDRLHREKGRLEAKIEAIKGFAGSEAAARLDADIADRLVQRDADGRRLLELHSARIERMERIVVHFRAIMDEVPALHSETAEMRGLWNSHVNERTESRTMDRYAGIHRSLFDSQIRDYLEANGKALLREQPTGADRVRAGWDMSEFLADNEPEFLKQLKREFPKLGED